jgi:hypothetical protein
MKTAMQQHLEWLKARMVVTEQMEQELLEQEKQQIIKTRQDIYVTGDLNNEQYYNQTFKQD